MYRKDFFRSSNCFSCFFFSYSTLFNRYVSTNIQLPIFTICSNNFTTFNFSFFMEEKCVITGFFLVFSLPIFNQFTILRVIHFASTIIFTLHSNTSDNHVFFTSRVNSRILSFLRNCDNILLYFAKVLCCKNKVSCIT